MNKFKDTYNIDPSYILKRINKDFKITYNLSNGEWVTYITDYHTNFTDKKAAEKLLVATRHASFFKYEKTDPKELDKIKENKSLLMELIELIEEKDEFIKKVGAAYRKNKQRQKTKLFSRQVKRVETTTSYELETIAENFGMTQKDALDMIIKDFMLITYSLKNIAKNQNEQIEKVYEDLKKEQEKILRKKEVY
jgi:Mg2+ and Co2+ transporter CorA